MTYQNILIIKMSSLGDVIHALPFAAALRETFPHSRISWLVHPQFSAFVPEPPIIDEVLYFDKKAFGKPGLCSGERSSTWSSTSRGCSKVPSWPGSPAVPTGSATARCGKGAGWCPGPLWGPMPMTM